MFEYLYEGVNHSIQGNGGAECANYVPMHQKIVETSIVIGWCGWLIFKGWSMVRLPKVFTPTCDNYEIGRRLVLMILSLVFGIEIGFKIATRASIYLLNPCHLLTAFQMYLLQSDPASRNVCIMFRIQVYSVCGAMLAVLFPVLNTRHLPFEVFIYYLQHGMLLIIPIFLMMIGGAYTPDTYDDFGWAFMSLGFLLMYHFLPLQIIGYITKVNLNSMLCPAISDPFHGRFYRCCAVIHQTLFVIGHGKLYVAFANGVISALRSELLSSLGWPILSATEDPLTHEPLVKTPERHMPRSLQPQPGEINGSDLSHNCENKTHAGNPVTNNFMEHNDIPATNLRTGCNLQTAQQRHHFYENGSLPSVLKHRDRGSAGGDSTVVGADGRILSLASPKQSHIKSDRQFIVTSIHAEQPRVDGT